MDLRRQDHFFAITRFPNTLLKLNSFVLYHLVKSFNGKEKQFILRCFRYPVLK